MGNDYSFIKKIYLTWFYNNNTMKFIIHYIVIACGSRGRDGVWIPAGVYPFGFPLSRE